MAVGVYNGNALTKASGTGTQYVNIPPIWYDMYQKMNSEDATQSDWTGLLSNSEVLIPVLPGVLFALPAIITLTEGSGSGSVITYLRYNPENNRFYYTGDGQHYTWSISDGYIHIAFNTRGLSFSNITVVADFPICQLNHPDRLFVSNDQVLTVQENQQQKLISQRCGYTVTSASIAFPSNFIPLSVDMKTAHSTFTYAVTLDNDGYPAITHCTVDSGAGYVSRDQSYYTLQGGRIIPSLLVKQLSDPTYNTGVLASPVNSTLQLLQTTDNYVLKPLQETAPFSIINDGCHRTVKTDPQTQSETLNGYFLTPFNCTAASNSNINANYSAQHGLQTGGGFTYTYNNFDPTRTSTGALNLSTNPVDRNKALFIYTAYQWPVATTIFTYTMSVVSNGVVVNPSSITFYSANIVVPNPPALHTQRYRCLGIYTGIKGSNTETRNVVKYGVMSYNGTTPVHFDSEYMTGTFDSGQMTFYFYYENFERSDGYAQTQTISS